ncbi:MAG: hypothetical protein AAFW89_09520 [Bacteroidota bacterium]
MHIRILLAFLFLFSLSTDAATQLLDWKNLSNPVYSKEGWSTKDATMTWHEPTETFYIFFSAFFFDEGRERCHVTGVRTRDFITFSDPLFIWSGIEEGWIGFCSPNLTRFNDRYVLTFNSWGDKKGRANQLFYAESDNLENWSAPKPLGSNVTNGHRAIDAAVYPFGDTVFLFWKLNQTPQVSYAPSLASEQWKTLGNPGLGWFENAQLLNVDNEMYLVATARKHRQMLFKMDGDPANTWDWLKWNTVGEILAPLESFNTDERMNAGFLADWRSFDGYFYYLYAGRTEGESHAGRGNQKLALIRSQNLEDWVIPGQE